MTFVAKKVGIGRYDLRRDGETFATLAHAGMRWTLKSADKALVVLFNQTKWSADVTLTGVLRAIRSMVDFLTERRAAETIAAAAAKHEAELAAIAERARQETLHEQACERAQYAALETDDESRAEMEREDRLSFAADMLDAQYAV